MISIQNEQSNNICDYSDYHEKWSNININLIQNRWDTDFYEDNCETKNTENKYLEEYIIRIKQLGQNIDFLLKRVRKRFIDFFAN